MHIRPFSVFGVVGTADGKWAHTALTWTLCELPALLRDCFGRPCQPGGSAVPMIKDLCRHLTTWVNEDFRTMFGDAQRPKLHKILAHLFDEFILRGNFQDGDTGLNEALHACIKQAWLRTNHRPDEYALQLMMAEQVASMVAGALGSKARTDDAPRDD